MARDLIGPALPPGFKEHGTVEDEERDPSPGEQQRASALAGRFSEHRGVGAVRPGGQAGPRRRVWDLIIIKMIMQFQFAVNTNKTVLTDQSLSGRLFTPSINCIRKDDGWCICDK